METKHTPGPWTHYDDSQDGKTNRHEIVGIGKTVAHIYCSVPDEDAANARLIAAAPELLAALIEARDALFSVAPVTDGLEHQINAAIAKAEGK